MFTALDSLNQRKYLSIFLYFCSLPEDFSLSSKKQLQFIYSEKATKFCEILTLLLTVCTVVKSKVKISQNFVAFLKKKQKNFVKTIHRFRIQDWWLACDKPVLWFFFRFTQHMSSFKDKICLNNVFFCNKRRVLSGYIAYIQISSSNLLNKSSSIIIEFQPD